MHSLLWPQRVSPIRTTKLELKFGRYTEKRSKNKENRCDDSFEKGKCTWETKFK